MLKIRLSRRGRRNAPFFDVIVAEARQRKTIEKVGYYNPRLKTDNRVDKFNLNVDRIQYWKSKGAQATEVVEKILTTLHI